MGVDRVPQKSFSFVGCVSAVHQISSTGIGTSGREDRDPPEGGDDGRGTEVTVERVAWPWRKFILELVVREDALPEISFVMMLVRWMMWRLCCRRQRPISNSRNPQAGELLTGGRLVVNFHDDPGWDHSRLFLWPTYANTWIVLTLDCDKYAEKISDYSKMRVPPPPGESETPEIGSVDSVVVGISMSSASWCEKEEIWPFVRGPNGIDLRP